MDLHRVQSGEPLKVPADVYNALLDLLERSTAPRPPAPLPGPPSTLIRVRNDSGADRGWFEVLALDGPCIEPDTSMKGFIQACVFKGIVPAAGYEGRFAVLQEPIKHGAIGRAMVCGVTAVQVAIGNGGDRFADLDTAGGFHLVSNAKQGNARILWPTAVSGSQWALVRMPADALDVVLNPWWTDVWEEGVHIGVEQVAPGGEGFGLLDVGTWFGVPGGASNQLIVLGRRLHLDEFGRVIEAAPNTPPGNLMIGLISAKVNVDGKDWDVTFTQVPPTCAYP